MRAWYRLTCVLLAAFLLCVLAAGEAAADRSSSRQELVELGRRLFFDATATRGGQHSCASCHSPDHGFSDPRRFSEDENGTTRRHSQPVADLVDGVGFHWDHEFDTLRQLLTARIAGPVTAVAQARTLHNEHFQVAARGGRNPDRNEYQRRIRALTPPYYGAVQPRGRVTPRRLDPEVRLRRGDRYQTGFRRAFGSSKITAARIIDSLEAYLLSLRTGENRFDRYVAGNPSALNEQERAGLRLFAGKANCASCHDTEAVDGRVLLTDNKFHNTGVTIRNVALTFSKGAAFDGGYGETSFVEKDLGKFKTPSLRDVAKRSPYMHDGSMKTLEDVVDYYDAGGTANAHLDANISKLKLTAGEKQNLLAFLRALSSEERAGLGGMAAHRPRSTRLRIHDVQGKSLAGLEIEVVPAGDRLMGARRQELEPIKLTTDRTGRIRFAFPPSTHVRVKAKGFEIRDWLIPDYVANSELMAVPRHQVVMRVIAPDGTTRMPARITAIQPNNAPRAQQREVVVVALFQRVRQLAPTEALYLADVDAVRGKRGRVNVFLSFKPKNGLNAIREIDLSGGETDAIDLRR